MSTEPLHSSPVAIRNFGIIAHIDAGKTTTTENLLRYARVIHKTGSVDDGTTTTDDYVLEQRKGITIFSAAVTCQWRDCMLNLVDTPGHVDFTAEVERALRVLDGAVVVFDAVSGVEAQTETVWRQAARYGVPRLCYLNKMDRLGAGFERSLESIRSRLGGRPVVLTLPVGAESGFEGVVDVLRMNMLKFDAATDGELVTEHEVPSGLRDTALRYRREAIEAAAEFDEGVMEKYVGDEEPALEQLKCGLRKGTLAGAIQPAYAGASRHHKGVQPVMDGIVDFLPSPLDRPVVQGRDGEGRVVVRDVRKDGVLCALAFKTTTDQHGELTFLRVYTGALHRGDALWNPRLRRSERPTRLYRMFANHKRDPVALAGPGEIVAVVGLRDTVTGDTLCDAGSPVALESMHFAEPVLQVAIEPKLGADKEKLDTVLRALAKDDPTFRVARDGETGQTMLQCMGELHAEVIHFRITNDFKVGATLREPRVAYKEMPLAPAEGEASVTLKAGEKVMTGQVRVRVTPSREQLGPRIREDLLEEDARKSLARFLPAIRLGMLSEAERGPVAGYSLIYADLWLLGGTVTTDSAEAAFSAAAAGAVRNALARTEATIVEPHMRFEVTSPESAVGAIVGDLNRRGASITDMRGVEGGRKVVSGAVPLAQMFGYATTMRSLTAGLGTYTLEPFDYRPLSEADYRERFGGLGGAGPGRG